MEEDEKILKAQPGPQTMFLQTRADIAIYGGAAGGGKTWALLYEPLRHFDNEKFGGVIFRRTSPQIRNEGGLWDESKDIYSRYGARPLESTLEWRFPSGMKMKFSHMEQESDKMNWDGAQIPYIGFDELTHFSRSQFMYLLSRNRSKSGVAGYIRATCNPDPDSFVAHLVDWWIDDDGFAIQNRSGKLRWFIVENDELMFADSKAELYREFGKKCRPLSFTFIPSKVTDNKILLKNDPSYLAKLDALSSVDRARKRDGNWKIRESAGLFFKKEFFEIVSAAPVGSTQVRFWDRAATVKTAKNDPAFTVGLNLSRAPNGYYFVEDVRRFRESPMGVENLIKNTATHDGKRCRIGLEQEPGASGKSEVQYLIRQLSGFDAKAYPATTDKVSRAKPVSSQAEAGNIKVVRGDWNADFFREIESFPEGKFKDQVDALSGAFQMLQDQAPLNFVMGPTNLTQKSKWKF